MPDSDVRYRPKASISEHILWERLDSQQISGYITGYTI
jgi:hypothetical protein